MSMTWVKHSCRSKTAPRDTKTLLELFLLFNHLSLKFEEENEGRRFINTPLFLRPAQSVEQFTANGVSWGH